MSIPSRRPATGPVSPHRVVLALALIGLATACSGGSRQLLRGDPFAKATEGKREIHIRVTNLNFADARLWALRAGQRIHLGTVTGKDEGVFTVAWPFNDPLQIEIDLLAGGRCTTRPIPVDAGDVIDLQIDVTLERSNLCR